MFLTEPNFSLQASLARQTITNKTRYIITNLDQLNAISSVDTVVYTFNENAVLDEEIILAKIVHILTNNDNPCFRPVMKDEQSKATLFSALKAARSKATVLITGETGTGKEIIAQYIHYHSEFYHGPFVAVNCAAMPANMIEAILFGYEKGAFTNAINSHVGKFEQANHGTILLDEISEIPLELQAKLLRVLQEREVERLGGKKSIKIDVRVIAAANKNIREQVDTGDFRKDLYYRLNVIPFHCLPLRERVMDIIPLAEYFMERDIQKS